MTTPEDNHLEDTRGPKDLKAWEDRRIEALRNKHLRALAARELAEINAAAAAELERLTAPKVRRTVTPAEHNPHVVSGQPFPIFPEPNKTTALGVGVGVFISPADEERQPEIDQLVDATLGFYTGLDETADPLDVINAFPHVVRQAARYLEKQFKDILTQLGTPREWEAPKDAPAVWEEDQTRAPAEWNEGPAEDIALQAALVWLRATKGQRNPFATEGRLQLEEAATDYLADIAELWQIELTPTPATPTYAPPLISTSRPSWKLPTLGELQPGVTPPEISAGKETTAAIHMELAEGTKAIKLSGVHRAVSDGISAIFLAKDQVADYPGAGWTISATEVARHIFQTPQGGRSPSPAQVRAVTAVIEELRATVVTATITPYGYVTGPKLVRTEPLFLASYQRLIYPNGSVVEGWRSGTLPLLTSLAHDWKQTRQVDVMLDGYYTPDLEQVAIVRYIATRVIAWNGKGLTKSKGRKKGNWRPLRLPFLEIEDQLGTPGPTVGQSRKIRTKWIPDALNDLQARGFITGWKKYKEGRTFVGVEIYLAEGWTAADLTNYRHNQLNQIEDGDEGEE